MEVFVSQISVLKVEKYEKGDTVIDISIAFTPISGHIAISKQDLSSKLLNHLIMQRFEVKESGRVEVDEEEYLSFINWRSVDKAMKHGKS